MISTYNHTNPINPTTAAIEAAPGTPAPGAAFSFVSALTAEALPDELLASLDPELDPEPGPVLEPVAVAEVLDITVDAALMAEVAAVGL